MAAKDPAAADVSSHQDLIDLDLYGDLAQNNGEEGDFDKEASDLYDAVLTGTVSQQKEKVPANVPAASKDTRAKAVSKPAIVYTCSGGTSAKRLSLYIGNFSWWTSDVDLIKLAQTLGVNDVVDIKFAENRANGQSRGYAEVVVSTEDSMKRLLEKVPNCSLNGEQVDCRSANRQTLALFESVANKRIPQRTNSTKDSKDDSTTPGSHGDYKPPILPHNLPPHLLPTKPPAMTNPFFNRPPPLFPPIPPPIPPPAMPHLYPPPPLPMHNQPPPSLHINPAFFPPAHDSFSRTSYNRQNDTQSSPTPNGDFDELMNQNRAIASSAITKAVSGATAGDLRVAMETLLTAIAVIKQSRVYADERCRALVTSLKDCLVSIQGTYSARNRHRSRERERERDRERDRERERERDRDREVDRDSNRDREGFYNQGWETFGVSRRHRERSSSGERERERIRERDRDRDRYRERDRDRHR